MSEDEAMYHLKAFSNQKELPRSHFVITEEGLILWVVGYTWSLEETVSHKTKSDQTQDMPKKNSSNS